MADQSFLDWPFFAPRHRDLSRAVEVWAAAHVDRIVGAGDDLDTTCISLVRALGEAGLCRYAVVDGEDSLDVRALCLIRE
nr:hypothetical protein [Pseudomonadales bacterium]